MIKNWNSFLEGLITNLTFDIEKRLKAKGLDVNDIRNIFIDYMDEYSLHGDFKIIDYFPPRDPKGYSNPEYEKYYRSWQTSNGGFWTPGFQSLQDTDNLIVDIQLTHINSSRPDAAAKYIRSKASQELLQEIAQRMEEIGYSISLSPSYNDIQIIGFGSTVGVVFKFQRIK